MIKIIKTDSAVKSTNIFIFKKLLYSKQKGNGWIGIGFFNLLKILFYKKSFPYKVDGRKLFGGTLLIKRIGTPNKWIEYDASTGKITHHYNKKIK